MTKRKENSPRTKESRLETESRVWAPYGIASALIAMENAVENAGYGKPGAWTFPEEGRAFSEHLPAYRKGALDEKAMSKILKTCAQVGGVDVVNKFLGDSGYSIQLEPVQPSPGEVDVSSASIIDILVSWAYPGDARKLEVKGTERNVDAVFICDGGYVFYESSHNPGRLVASIETEDENTRVYLTNNDAPVREDAGLERVINEINGSLSYYGNRAYEGIIFPMVDFAYKGKIDWIIGAYASLLSEETAVIKEALIEQRFRMNEKGARAQQAVIEMMVCLSGRQPEKLPPYKFDGQQLLVWFERTGKDGKPLVVYSALVTPEHMKNPGSLT